MPLLLLSPLQLGSINLFFYGFETACMEADGTGEYTHIGAVSVCVTGTFYERLLSSRTGKVDLPGDERTLLAWSMSCI